VTHNTNATVGGSERAIAVYGSKAHDLAQMRRVGRHCHGSGSDALGHDSEVWIRWANTHGPPVVSSDLSQACDQ
jgi:hypothetical protein